MADKYSIIIYPKAGQDMETIFDYIANTLFNPDAARNQIKDFQAAFER